MEVLCVVFEIVVVGCDFIKCLFIVVFIWWVFDVMG